MDSILLAEFAPFRFPIAKSFKDLFPIVLVKENTYLNNSPSNPGVKGPEYQVGLTSELHSSQY